MPLMATSRLVSMTYIEDQSIDINNLPFEQEEMISIPLDVMSLTFEEENYVTGTSEVSMSWNLDNLPEHIDLILVDNLTGEMVYLNNQMSHTFTTEPKGSFSATYEEAVGIYPLLGDARFSVQVSYGALNNALVKVIPKDYALSPVYPNPFNPFTNISFVVDKSSEISLKIFDVNGKLIQVVNPKTYQIGVHNIQWNASSLSSGMYFIHMLNGADRYTQKVMLLK